jgi:CRP-like cAMP-binding protein
MRVRVSSQSQPVSGYRPHKLPFTYQPVALTPHPAAERRARRITMVAPELLRASPFFGEFSADRLAALAQVAEEITVPQGHRFFFEGEDPAALYLVLEGSVALSVSLPEKCSRVITPHPAARTRDVVLSVARASDIFAWSALVPPFKATSNARAAERCRLVAVSTHEMRQRFETDPAFGYQMLLKVAQIARDRLLDLHYEALGNAIAVG